MKRGDKTASAGFVIKTAWCGNCWWHVNEQFHKDVHPDSAKRTLQRQHDGAGRDCKKKIRMEGVGKDYE